MQQINLYLPEFQPNREPIRAIHMLWMASGFLVLLIIMTLLSSREAKRLELQLQQDQQLQTSLQQQLKVLAAQKPMQAASDLDAQIEKLQKDLQRHNQILVMISHQDLGNDKGFSAQMSALSAAALSTVSIESFALLRGGKYAELSGLTRSADQIPFYITRLRADPSFSNVGFGVLNVERDKEQTSLLKFSLAKPKEDKNTPQGDR